MNEDATAPLMNDTNATDKLPKTRPLIEVHAVDDSSSAAFEFSNKSSVLTKSDGKSSFTQINASADKYLHQNRPQSSLLLTNQSVDTAKNLTEDFNRQEK